MELLPNVMDDAIWQLELVLIPYVITERLAEVEAFP
jgi:hypothetical protein